MLMTAKQRCLNESLDKERAEIVSRLNHNEQRLNNGINKTMTCPQCRKPITVGLHDPFKCPCGWGKEKPNGGAK